MKKIIITSILLTISIFLYGQVTVSIANLKVNGVSVPNGSPINLGINSSVGVTFRVDLSKPDYLTVGPCEVWISVFNSSGVVTHLMSPLSVPVSEFTTGASANISTTIYASSVDFNNGNYLSATLEQDNSPFAIWESQHIPIIKTPEFELTPSSLSLPCGNTSSRTFTVSNNSNLSGVTYQWNIGSGWSGNVSNGNSITLTPASATTLPSHVVVTPYVNGVAQTSKTCVVSRASFTSNAVISGNTQICPGGNGIYTINNLETGNTVTWSSSNTAVATVSGATQSQVTVNGVSQGTINLIAKLTNPCGQTIDKSFRIIVGSPTSNIIGFPHNGMTFGVNNYVTFSVNSNFNYSQIQWVVNGGTIIEGQNTNTITVLTNPSANTILTVSVRIYTNCGWGNYFTRNGTLINGTSPISKIYPNPSNDNIHLSELSKADYNSNTIIEIFDIFGKSVIKTKIEDSKNGISIRDLKTGIYFVKIYSTKEIETYNFVKN